MEFLLTRGQGGARLLPFMSLPKRDRVPRSWGQRNLTFFFARHAPFLSLPWNSALLAIGHPVILLYPYISNRQPLAHLRLSFA